MKVKLTITQSDCRCGYFREGQEFLVEDLCPPLCHELWSVIYPYVFALQNGGLLDHGAGKAAAFDASCPDGGRVRIHGEILQPDFGQQVIEKALLYVNHEWYARKENVLHGKDEVGRYVDTPDVSWRGEELACGWWKVNQMNRGVPYCWGKASTLEEFDRGIAQGAYAGNVPEDTGRKGSHQCVGVDCSGLVTVCWELPEKIRARDIPEVAEQIDFKELQVGDALATAFHVMLFQAFLDEDKQQLRIIDATRSTGKVSQREFYLEELAKQGFAAYRKR